MYKQLNNTVDILSKKELQEKWFRFLKNILEPYFYDDIIKLICPYYRPIYENKLDRCDVCWEDDDRCDDRIPELCDEQIFENVWEAADYTIVGCGYVCRIIPSLHLFDNFVFMFKDDDYLDFVKQGGDGKRIIKNVFFDHINDKPVIMKNKYKNMISFFNDTKLDPRGAICFEGYVSVNKLRDLDHCGCFGYPYSKKIIDIDNCRVLILEYDTESG